MPKECAVCKQPAVLAARITRGDQVANVFLCENCVRIVGRQAIVEILSTGTPAYQKGNIFLPTKEKMEPELSSSRHQSKASIENDTTRKKKGNSSRKRVVQVPLSVLIVFLISFIILISAFVVSCFSGAIFPFFQKQLQSETETEVSNASHEKTIHDSKDEDAHSMLAIEETTANNEKATNQNVTEEVSNEIDEEIASNPNEIVEESNHNPSVIVEGVAAEDDFSVINENEENVESLNEEVESLVKPELDEMVINTPVDHDALDGCVKSFIDLYDLNPMLYVIDHYENWEENHVSITLLLDANPFGDYYIYMIKSQYENIRGMLKEAYDAAWKMFDMNGLPIPSIEMSIQEDSSYNRILLTMKDDSIIYDYLLDIQTCYETKREDVSFRNSLWGDSVETVVMYEPTDFTTINNTSAVSKDIIISGLSAKIVYSFDPNYGLYRCGYAFMGQHTINYQYISDFYNLRDDLMAKYGPCSVDTVYYYSDLYQYCSEGDALILGYTCYYAEWWAYNTKIELTCKANDNNGVTIMIRYICTSHPNDISGNGL